VSTKVLRCPWCKTTNLTTKLVARHDKCRECGNRVVYGLNYLREQKKKRRQATTRAERTALRRAERARPEWKAIERQKRAGRAYRRADLRAVDAWQRVVLSANEHDFAGVVASTRALVRAERAKQQALRAMQRLQQAAPETTGTRAIILPTDEGGRDG